MKKFLAIYFLGLTSIATAESGSICVLFNSEPARNAGNRQGDNQHSCKRVESYTVCSYNARQAGKPGLWFKDCTSCNKGFICPYNGLKVPALGN